MICISAANLKSLDDLDGWRGIYFLVGMVEETFECEEVEIEVLLKLCCMQFKLAFRLMPPCIGQVERRDIGCSGIGFREEIQSSRVRAHECLAGEAGGRATKHVRPPAFAAFTEKGSCQYSLIPFSFQQFRDYFILILICSTVLAFCNLTFSFDKPSRR
jgi:hypothetical protein